MTVLLGWWTRGQERRPTALRLQPASVTAAARRAPLGQRAFLGRQPGRSWPLLVGAAPRPRWWSGRSPRRPATASTCYRALGSEGQGTVARRADRSTPSPRRCATPSRPPCWPSALGVLRRRRHRLRPRPWRRRLLDTGLMLPLGTSAVTIGFGLLITMDRPPLDLRGSWMIIPIAHALVAMPFVVRAVLPVAARHRPAPARGRRRRSAPARPGVVRGRRADGRPRRARRAPAFAFAVSIGEFGATAFLVRSGSPDAAGRHRSSSSAGPARSTSARPTRWPSILMVVTAVVILAVDRFRSGADAPTF